MSGILVAGIGNIFKGDDGFGVAVAQRLARRELPPGVKVVDFGIRGLDLTYALLDGYQAVVMIDSAQRGERPGTVYVIEPELQPHDDAQNREFSPHELDPAKVLRLARYLGGECQRVVIVACEPLTFGGEDGAMGLSQVVAAAVEPAIATVEEVLGELLGNDATPHVANTLEEGSFR